MPGRRAVAQRRCRRVGRDSAAALLDARVGARDRPRDCARRDCRQPTWMWLVCWLQAGRERCCQQLNLPLAGRIYLPPPLRPIFRPAGVVCSRGLSCWVDVLPPLPCKGVAHRGIARAVGCGAAHVASQRSAFSVVLACLPCIISESRHSHSRGIWSNRPKCWWYRQAVPEARCMAFILWMDWNALARRH